MFSDNKFKVDIPNFSSVGMCCRHPNEHLKLFCGDDNVLCCNKCGFPKHRKCEKVIIIDNMIKKKFDDGIKYNDVEANIRNLQRYMKRIKSKRIQSLRVDKLQQLEDDLIVSLEGHHTNEDLNMRSQDARRQSLITAINRDLTQFELVLTHRSEVQNIIVLHEWRKTKPYFPRPYQRSKNLYKISQCGLDIIERLIDLMNDLNGF
ncbi:hypothetical protein CHS0354_018018 [Potamilus streckersoni]|uniref:B box-type domain-containing protein n=1 Tax=Potamilus streckersoni TaxID=2493646 RepID=A0AAE0VFM0_9BIVA|nr:hypothetical protein CHS0354_018018 [Potamilus streckersoni]